MKIVEVTWIDARHDFGQISIREINPGALMKTVGYLIRRDKEFVVIAMEYWPERETYNNVTSIPASIVKKVRYVER